MNKTRYYVSRKNPLTWLAALLLAGAIVLRIGLASFWSTEAVTGNTLWFAVILPAGALLLYLLQLLTNWNQRFYKTAIPVCLLCLCEAIRYTCTHHERLPFLLLLWLMFVVIAVVYTVVTAGVTKRDWALLAIFGLPLGYTCFANWKQITTLQFSRDPLLFATLLELLAGLLVVFAMRVFCDGKYHPTWGDRPDGRRLRTLDPIAVIGNYIMPSRNGASIHFEDSIEISEMERYIRKKRAEGMTEFGITDVFLAAYVRCIAKFPACNRFLAGQRVYARDEDILFCMTIKKEMTTSGSESILKLHLHPNDSVQETYRKYHAAVEEIRNTPLDSDFDNTAKYLTYIPGVLLKFLIWLLRVLDYFGLMPHFLLELSPFHSSIFFTSMGSLGIPPVIHHLYDFGNMPAFCAFGAKRRVRELQQDGTIVQKKYVDYTFNLDERIVDGFYYAEVLRYLRRLLKHPETLDITPSEWNRDVD